MAGKYMQRQLLTFAVVLLLSPATQLLGADVEKVDNFTLTDYNGKKHSLSDYKEAKAIVLMFIATRCPVSNAYNERMAALYSDYAQKGVAFLGINSNKTEGVEEVKKHAEEHGLLFPILKDVNNIIANKLEATVTPEIYVLDANFDVLYHGSIDDSRRPDQVKSHSLRKALDEILAGKQVSEKVTKAFGCTIKKV
jgi:peroxiredoxin